MRANKNNKDRQAGLASGRKRRPEPSRSGTKTGVRRSGADTHAKRSGSRRENEARQSGWLTLADEVIRICGRKLPADQALREVLKRSRSVSPQLKRLVAEAVHAYYRWVGWMEEPASTEARIRRSRELAARFESAPQSFADAELRKRVVPAWVWKYLTTDLEWCRFLQRQPVLWLRAKRGGVEALCRDLGNCRKGPAEMPEAVRYLGREDLFRTEAFLGGRFELQDLSSQAVGLVCDPRPGEHWWDVCAGEGGKTMHLAERMEGRGVVWATDRARWRLERLQRRAARSGVFNYQIRAWDVEQKPPIPFPVDGALVDAPCSGMGTWQRNPQARWTLLSADVEELAELQLALLRAATKRVKPGGRLVYSVCTLTRRETTGVAGEFEGLEPEFEPCAVSDPFNPQRSAARLWLKPWAQGGNGMFVASWRRCGPDRRSQQRERRRTAG